MAGADMAEAEKAGAVRSVALTTQGDMVGKGTGEGTDQSYTACPAVTSSCHTGVITCFSMKAASSTAIAMVLSSSAPPSA